MKATSQSRSLQPIQMLWVRGDLSRLELLSVRSFLAQGHPVHLYTYDPPRNLPANITIMAAAEIVEDQWAPLNPVSPFAKGSMAAFSDYFRYQLLFKRGGWWADMDVVALKPFQNFPEIVVASTDEAKYGRIANTFVLHFPAAHPTLSACLAALDHRKLEELDITQTGPLLLNSILGVSWIARHAQAPEVFAPIPWNSSTMLVSPYWRFAIDNFKHRLRRPHLACHFTKDTIAIHLWNETWRHAGLDKNASYPFTSWYERLQRHFSR